MVSRHILDRFPPQHSVSVELASVQQHLGEATIVINGCHHASTTREKRGSLVVWRSSRIVLQLESPTTFISIACRELFLGKGGDLITGVVHSQGFCNPLANKYIQISVREQLHKIATDVGRDAVIPTRSRRERQRNVGQVINHALERRSLTFAAYGGIPIQGIDRVAIHESVRQPRGMRQQMLERHRHRGWGRHHCFAVTVFVHAQI